MLNALVKESLELNLAAYVPVFLYVVWISQPLFVHPPVVKLLLSNPSKNNCTGLGVGVGSGVLVGKGNGAGVLVGVAVPVGVGVDVAAPE